jgi:hypothetical protein
MIVVVREDLEGDIVRVRLPSGYLGTKISRERGGNCGHELESKRSVRCTYDVQTNCCVVSETICGCSRKRGKVLGLRDVLCCVMIKKTSAGHMIPLVTWALSDRLARYDIALCTPV